MTDALTRPIRVGVVGASVTAGASDWAAHAHVPALHALPDFELTAVCTNFADGSPSLSPLFHLVFDEEGRIERFMAVR